MLKRISIVAPKSRYVSGKGASGAGLTAAVVKDEFLRGGALEAGALVLTNKGLCCIDELDKMSNEDRDAMHEALEQQTISISKANIQATLRAETTVLAAANPKFGRFDPYEMIAKQIDLPSTLINRFDLIFPIRDLPNKDRDEKMARFILNMHQTASVGEIEIPTEFMRKYLAYAKQKIHPKLTDSALDEIKEFYVKMRGSGGEGEIKPIPVSARQLEALDRLAEASAKLRLSDKVLKKDAKKAIELLQYCLSNIGVDPRTGKIDIDVISTGIPSSERSRISQIKEIILGLEERVGKKIPIEDIMSEGAERGIERAEIEEIIEKLKRSGDLFEPQRNFLQRI
jgi:replicative DNA helicase Mcm